MYFGLISGSYTKNTSGGVLRKNIGSIKDEIDTQTGVFKHNDLNSSVEGIIKTIDRFKIVGFNYSSNSYNKNCGWITDEVMAEGQCRDWGNPVAEMMYEALRYFSGAKSPTGDFTYDASATNDDNTLGLPLPGWLDPFTNGEDVNVNGKLDTGEDVNKNGLLDGFDYCAKPFMLVLSDINPTFDSDQLPGNDFNGAVNSTLAGLDVGGLANTISFGEGGYPPTLSATPGGPMTGPVPPNRCWGSGPSADCARKSPPSGAATIPLPWLTMETRPTCIPRQIRPNPSPPIVWGWPPPCPKSISMWGAVLFHWFPLASPFGGHRPIPSPP